MTTLQKLLLSTLSILTILILCSCSTKNSVSPFNSGTQNGEILSPKANHALLLVALSPPANNNITLLVGEKNVGLLTGQEVIALHIKPGEYSVRSSYQACFPADVTLRKGETLLIEAQTTDKGIYFKPAAYDKIINLVAGRPFKEIRY